MIRFFIFLFFSLFLTHISSQYIFGTNVAQPNAIITIQSVDSLKGIKIPVVKSSDLLSPTSDMASMIIYDIQDSCF